jgi:putative oxygen-independent coproporphyrinogen III oxidase
MPLERPPLSLYVHLPWCVRKCPYCDFNSHQHSDPPEQAYLEALLEDLDAEVEAAQGRPIETLFFGGGTPSLMSGDFYHALMRELRARLRFAPDIEVTLEVNPGSLEQDRFAAFRAAGINRLSIGVQSFQSEQLEALGRIHGPDEARRAVATARAAGFDDFNLDLMHGLPGQTPAQARADLDEAIALAPTHISWYELTIEPNTAFYSAPPERPDEDTLAAIEDTGLARLAQAGYQRYEVSAFARSGHECRHNLNYWRFGDYLALGAGAHGKMTFPHEDRVLRYWKTRQPDHYLNAVGNRTRGHQELERAERPLEFALNALRLVNGVPEPLLEARTGIGTHMLRETLRELREIGLLRTRTDRLACTQLGLTHLNEVLARF